MPDAVIVMGTSGRWSVDQASHMLKRLYYTERELMRTVGGFLVNVSNWEMKTCLPKHIWQDSLRADALRTRILEMRYPRRDVDQGQEDVLQAYLSSLIRCSGDAELLEGVYFVTKRYLLQAYRAYLELTDELDDAPTVSLLQRFMPEIEGQIAEAEAMYKGGLEEGRGASAVDGWRCDLERCLERIGGFMNDWESLPAGPIDEVKALLASLPAYVPPLVPARDPAFEKAVYHMPPRNPEKFIERQVWAGINHVNEIWAAEIPGLVMWKWDDMPWEFYLESARWAYDEARHSLMGVRRLAAWGIEVGKDIPVVADHYASVSAEGELAVLALLHAFEVNGPYWKSLMKSEFEQIGDTASSQDFDYDWADESIHLAYGHKWVLHRLGGDTDALEDLKEQVMDDWKAWIDKAHQVWDYEPFMSRIGEKISEIEERSRAN